MTKSKIILVLVVLIIICMGLFFVAKKSSLPVVDVIDHKNASYIIEGENVTLNNGVAESVIVDGAASKKVTLYFGNEAEGDLNGDGTGDVAFILTQTSAGSGTFFYVVVALKTESGYKGTNAIFLGDRISPQTTEIKDGKLIVNYADRRISELMATPPSVGVSKYLKIEGNNLIEVTPN